MEAETSETTRTLVAGAVGNSAGPGKWVRSWGVALGLHQLAELSPKVGLQADS